MIHNYAKISIDDIPEFFQARPFDIYLKLSSAKFVKIINSDDDTFEETLQDYHARGIDFLYCDSNVYDEIRVKIESKIDEGIHSAEKSENLEDRYDGLSTALNGIRGMIHNLGMTDSVQRKADTLINAMLSEAEKNTRLEILFELLEQKSGFITKQGFLTSYIVVAMVEEMDWATAAVKKKLVTASLFQNIALDSDQQAKITNLHSPEFNKLDDFEKELVAHHPILSADLVQAPGFGGDEVQKLIKNHHELLHGGFPGRVQPQNLPILDACFVIASFYATKVILMEEEKKDYSILAQTLNEEFSEGVFKRAFLALLFAVANR